MRLGFRFWPSEEDREMGDQRKGCCWCWCWADSEFEEPVASLWEYHLRMREGWRLRNQDGFCFWGLSWEDWWGGTWMESLWLRGKEDREKETERRALFMLYGKGKGLRVIERDIGRGWWRQVRWPRGGGGGSGGHCSPFKESPRTIKN